IIHGDITYINDGAYIVSSDDLMYILSLKFRPRLAIFTIRERGIINKDGKTITVLSADDLTNIIDLRCEKYVDVTGGLLRKLEICFKIAKICDVYVCYYDHNTLLNLILNSKCDNCTKIVSNI
ncbi:MAG: hypothetical protein GXO26_09225, partial [Crenarchaeota archaeon]|nr:hypothetical protein [Thermoproteota archaeon]